MIEYSSQQYHNQSQIALGYDHQRNYGDEIKKVTHRKQ